jgi:hypothetical protein
MMAQRYLIVVGDPTTAGGEALEGDSGWMIQCVDGVHRPVVTIGHSVLCGQCGPTTVVEGCSGWLVSQPVAYDGCALACGHKLVAKLQRGCSTEVADGSSRAASYREEQVAPQGASAEQGFDEHFHFFDDVHGIPLSGISCVLFPEDAAAVPGSLSRDGLTPRCRDESARRILAAISAPSPLLK